jgi:diguanylate cyclase (GGDEF)-like protein
MNVARENEMTRTAGYSEEVPAHFKDYKVLIVDDNIIELKYHIEVISHLCEVYFADSAELALRMATEHAPPDLIILDVMMPEMDGFSFAEQLKITPKTRDIPVVFLSASAETENKINGFQGGCMDYLVKPINEKELFHRVLLQLKMIDTNRKLESLSVIDPLTQVFNRRVYDEHLLTEWATCQRYDLPLSLIVVDIDDFKRYNDTYGHTQGDIILRKIADTLKRFGHRTNDKFARYGGEEFVLLLPDCSALGAQKIAAEMCHAVQQLEIDHRSNASFCATLTASFGVATIRPIADQPISTLFEHADAALYRAKKQGKAQVCVARPSPHHF